MSREQELQHLESADESGIRRYLADRMRRERKRMGLSQAEFAATACIPLRTYKRFENDGEASLETFVRAFMRLGNQRSLMLLFPEPLPPQQPTWAERIEDIAQYRPPASDERSVSRQDSGKRAAVITTNLDATLIELIENMARRSREMADDPSVSPQGSRPEDMPPSFKERVARRKSAQDILSLHGSLQPQQGESDDPNESPRGSCPGDMPPSLKEERVVRRKGRSDAS